jgi:type VI secretion system protein ImpI
MTLTLEVTGPQAAALGAASRKVFDAVGGTIGRLTDNTWALPDPYVSSRHAVIRYRDGTYYIEDTSTNGVFINSPDHQLVKGQPQALKSGDWIFIEPYEIRVSIDEPKPAPPPAPSPSSSPSPFDDLFGPGAALSTPPAANMRSAPIIGDPFDEPLGGPPLAGPGRGMPSSLYPSPDPLPSNDELDPLNLLGFEPKRAPSNAPSAADLNRSSVLSEHYQAPQVPVVPTTPPPASHGVLIPDDWLGLDDRSPSPPPPAPPPPAPPPPAPPRAVSPPPKPAEPPRPVARPAPAPPPSPPAAPVPRPDFKRAAAGGGGDLAAVLAGAGLENVDVTPELARNFGNILRVVVGGVMDILQARQRIKSEFRMGVTTFKPADNNPLKFSANVDDALHNMLVKRNAAYLGPVEAFEDAFDDLRHHQMAMLAGVRVAFEAMLGELDPDRLQEEFDRQLKKGSLLSVPAKLRYWDLYRDRIRDMVKDPETTFRELFGEEFAKAYEEQLRRLKAQSRTDKG